VGKIDRYYDCYKEPNKDDCCKCCKTPNYDKACIELGPLKMMVEKRFCSDTPNEITVVVPRVEIRETIKDNETVREYIYNSVTIVDSPIREPIDSVSTKPSYTTGTIEILEKIKQIQK
jgi:hypothetical protein